VNARRIIAILIAIVAIVIARTRDPGPDPSPVTDAPMDPPVRATVQEGLGASVAILLDNSGSMKDTPGTRRGEAKAAIARDVLERVLSQTDSFVARQPGFPVNVGLYAFNSKVDRVLSIGPYDREKLRAALAAVGPPRGGTAIGLAMETAVVDLYSAGTIRKYILVVTDGENTTGADPAEVAKKIERDSEGAVRLFLVAFDVDRKRFEFVSDVHGVLV
jgi:uncharacterized protein with von Willebrand factor type A (vWA) domain